MNYRKATEKLGWWLTEAGTITCPITGKRERRWYVDDPNLDYLDRRGTGYRTQKEAYQGLLEQLDYLAEASRG